jgi:hypothetical protein
VHGGAHLNPCLVAGLSAAGLLTAALAGCAPGSSGAQLTAAPRAGDAACVAALAKAPATVLGHPRTPIDVAGAAAWGEPPITLSCGLPEQPPSPDRCLTIGDIDWVVDDTGDPIVFTTYGRAPAAQVRVPLSYGRENATAALVDLATVAGGLARTAHSCVGIGDTATS